jgi:alkylation response protein AidB-like acyl-CoA dehydrogenase
VDRDVIVRYQLRRQDFSLADYQVDVRDSFAAFFRKECSLNVVRAAEPLGFSPDLWKLLVGMGVATMGLPVSVGGDGSSLVDLALVCEESGRTMAPVPLISHVVAGRLLARLDAPRQLVDEVASGGRTVTVALEPAYQDRRQLVPDSAVCNDVIAVQNDGVWLHTMAAPTKYAMNQARMPIGWWTPAPDQDRTLLGTGRAAMAAFTAAVAEWKVLMAAALVGLTEAALKVAVDFAKTRQTMGVTIGALQGVAFPLADVAIGVAGARNLTFKSAWTLEQEPGTRPELPAIAYAYAGEVAAHGTTTAAHTQGGLREATEAVATMYLLRATGWAVLGGDRLKDYAAIGRTIANRGPRAGEDEDGLLNGGS